MRTLRNLFIAVFPFFLSACNAQKPALVDIPVKNPEFQKELQGLLSFSTPTISVAEAMAHRDEYVFLDAREPDEFGVSHLPNAQWIGYRKFDKRRLAGIEKDQKIIVYCSVGYRSEKITEQLMELGYTQSFNLVGSLFEWANQGGPLVNTANESTQKVHAYNQKWSQWITHPEVEKSW